MAKSWRLTENWHAGGGVQWLGAGAGAAWVCCGSLAMVLARGVLTLSAVGRCWLT